ncbi:MAG: DUF547 domain-containing protein [Myxococcales bacterium]|nr:DUF547 domain-containing protein [Myxococcales bacterium]
MAGVAGALAVAAAAFWAWRAHGNAESPRVGSAVDACTFFEHQHSGWDAIVRRYVQAGWVDYSALRRDGAGELSAYLRSLESVCRGHFDTWTREEKLVFWINAYNAYTVKLVLEHYPVRSIRSIGLLPGAAFRRGFISLKLMGGRSLSLDDIEHGILRREFRDPRIHFAIVCASRSCPALRSEAYRARDIEAQLDEGARGFLADPSKNRVGEDARTLQLSSIFDWFRSDFEHGDQTLLGLVTRYGSEPMTAAASSGAARVEFLDYDWSLNGR